MILDPEFVVSFARRIVTHANCCDGLASAMLALDALPNIETVFITYNTPGHRELPALPGTVFVDMTPPAERVAEFVEAGAVVLDHHEHARDIVAAFGDRGVFADEPGRSGAVLAFQFFWTADKLARTASPRAVARFAELVGVRDTWQRHSPEWQDAADLHAVLKHFPREYWLRRCQSLAGGYQAALDMAAVLGRVLVDDRNGLVARTVQKGLLHYTAPDGVRWAVFPDREALVSDVAEAGRGEGIAVMVGWHARVDADLPRTVLSMRSDGSVDVGAIAKAHGGGGHRAAAGFSVPGWIDPYPLVQQLALGAWGRAGGQL